MSARPVWVATFLCALEHGRSVTVACLEAKITRSVAYERRESDSEFSEAWRAAQMTAERRMRAAFIERVVEQSTAVGRVPSPR